MSPADLAALGSMRAENVDALRLRDLSKVSLLGLWIGGVPIPMGPLINLGFTEGRTHVPSSRGTRTWDFELEFKTVERVR